MKLLLKGPNAVWVQYCKCLVNGFRFHTRELEQKRKTQNSGVVVNATTSSFSSVRDSNPICSDISYDYTRGCKVLLFDCDWVSKGKRLKEDEDGFLLANFENIKRHSKPYVLAAQVSQVFYIEDPLSKGWHVVITTSPRNEYKMEPTCDIKGYLQSSTCILQVDSGN